MKKRGARKCSHCRRLFLPDYRNRDRQEYCNKPGCRRVHKRESQRLWLAKPENLDYFKGPSHTARVRDWRKRHPGYWRGGRCALQDDCSTQHPGKEGVTSPEIPLQDDCLKTNPLIIGLISHFSGALQDDIAILINSLQVRGQMILGKGPGIETKKEAVYAAGEAGVMG